MFTTYFKTYNMMLTFCRNSLHPVIMQQHTSAFLPQETELHGSDLGCKHVFTRTEHCLINAPKKVCSVCVTGGFSEVEYFSYSVCLLHRSN